MKLEDILLPQKSLILKKWFEFIIDTYPDDTAKFLKREKDPFANPVGQNTLKALEALFDRILEKITQEELISFLDPLIRIRAIQDFSAAKAVSFIFAIKTVIRENFADEIKKNALFDDLLAFESKVDRLALLSFDIYMKCREKIYELKANEFKNLFSRTLERINLSSKRSKDESQNGIEET
jgi:hypothetical protein